MAGFTRTVVIDRPVEQVFDFATDLANAHHMMPNVTKTEWLTEGGMKPGARFKETRTVNGKERTAEITIIEHERPKLHAAYAGMMGLHAVYRFRFTPEGTGTRVDMEAIVSGNVLWWLFLGMMSRMMAKEDGEFLNRLKTAMEAKA
jgi:carbon monoxide dehydrogenase subunit G